MHLANGAIRALNTMYSGLACAGATARTERAAEPTRIQFEVLSYIFRCSLDFSSVPPCADEPTVSTPPDDYNDPSGGPVSIDSKLTSLPPVGGTFPIGDYLSPELQAYLDADPASLEDPLITGLAVLGARSCHRCEPEQYAALLARLQAAGMCDFQLQSGKRPLGLFGMWKIPGVSMRLIVDARPANCAFRTPPYEHTSGDCLARMQVPDGYTLLAAKADLADYFHACATRPGCRSFFPLRAVSARSLRKAGVEVPFSAVDDRGMTTPLLTTLPMGWGPSPSLAQGGHEAVLYGSAGDGSELAKGFSPVVDPSGRYSSQRVPDAAASVWHSMVIDDLLLFRLAPKIISGQPDRNVVDTVPTQEQKEAHDPPGAGVSCKRTAAISAPGHKKESTKEKEGALIPSAGLGLAEAGERGRGPPPAAKDVKPRRDRAVGRSLPERVGAGPPCQVEQPKVHEDLQRALDRYAEVGLPVKPSKVHDFAPTLDLLGYTLASDELRVPEAKYHTLEAAVLDLERRGRARPREVERLVGKFTNLFLLHRPALAIFSTVYVFARKCGHAVAPVWSSVIRELRMALGVLPLVRSDLARHVSELLLQSDACDTGSAAVYTRDVEPSLLREECRRPIRAGSVPARIGSPNNPPDPEPWRVETHLAAHFEAPTEPEAWRIAFRRSFGSSPAAGDTINVKELGAAVDAVRWASRSRSTRARRIVLQADSAVAVGILRKGRSSPRKLLRLCRRLAAITMAHKITLEARWVSTHRNMADRPSRGASAPGPCVAPAVVVRPRGVGQGGYAAQRVGEQSHPGPGPGGRPLSLSFWSPLFDANIGDASRERYAKAVHAFISFVRAHGDRVHTAEDADYWIAYYAHVAYTTGRPSKSEVRMALYGLEHWLPEIKPLTLGRRCLRGWEKLVPPRPAAPMTRDLMRACAAVAALDGDIGGCLAMLLSFDCWLRISEVSGLRPVDIVDTRGAADPVNRGVSVFLPEAKTGRRQAVRIDDADLAEMVVAWGAVSARAPGSGGSLFPPPASLRAVLSRCLRKLDDGSFDTRGLSFVWHSFRHGGASRAHLGGMALAEILTRGRWAVESSARHYIQAGRQMLLAIALPLEVAELARRVERVGIRSFFASDLGDRLRLA